MSDWKRVDLHMHTSFSGWCHLRLIDARDCYVPPERAFEVARKRGMNFVCFTDHDTIDGALDFLARHPEEEARVIVGEEVETRFPDSEQWLHINVYGVDERLHEDMTRLKPNCFELIAELRRRNQLFALNHPFHSFRSRRSAEEHLAQILPLIPAIELFNSMSPSCHGPVLETMLRAGGLSHISCLGGSDAHTTQRIARVHTLAPAGTKDEFLESVLKGECAIAGASQGLPALVRDVYRIIAAYYWHLYFEPYTLGMRRKLINIVSSSVLMPGNLIGVPAFLVSANFARQGWIARFGPWGRRELDRFPRHLPVSIPSGEDRPAGAGAAADPVGSPGAGIY